MVGGFPIPGVGEETIKFLFALAYVDALIAVLALVVSVAAFFIALHRRLHQL